MTDFSEFAPYEKLGRRVSSSRYINRSKRNNVPARMFEQRNTNELSVDRVHDDNLPKATSIAVAHDVGRGRNFYGWVVVPQDMAARNGRSIKASPREDNEFHADIVLPLEVVSDKEKRQQHASELATYARWQDPGRFG